MYRYKSLLMYRGPVRKSFFSTHITSGVSCSKPTSYNLRYFSINTVRCYPPREICNIGLPLYFSLSQCIPQGHHLINNHKASHNTSAYETVGFFISLLLSPHLFRLAADKRKSKAPDTHFS